MQTGQQDMLRDMCREGPKPFTTQHSQAQGPMLVLSAALLAPVERRTWWASGLGGYVEEHGTL